MPQTFQKTYLEGRKVKTYKQNNKQNRNEPTSGKSKKSGSNVNFNKQSIYQISFLLSFFLTVSL